MKLIQRVILLSILLIASIEIQAQEKSLIDSIRTEINSYRYQNALDLLDPLLHSISGIDTLRSEYIDLVLLKSQVLKRSYRTEEAIEVLVGALSEEDLNIRILIDIADCHKAMGNYEDALIMYQLTRSISYNPAIETEIALILLRLEKWPGAISVAMKALERDTTNVLLRIIGDSYNKYNNLEGHKDSALVYYNTIMRRRPDDVATLNKICHVHLQSNNPNKALKLAEEYLERNSSNVGMFEIKGVALYMNKQYEKSYEVFKYLIESGAESFGYYYYAGYNLFMLKRYYESITYLEKAKEIDPDSINNLYYLGTAQSYSGLIKESVENIEKGLSILLSQDSIYISKFYNSHYLGYITRSRYDDAISALQKARRFYPGDPTALFNLASTYERKEDHAKAKEYYLAYMAAIDKEYENGDGSHKNQRNYQIARSKVTDMEVELFFREK